MSIKPRHIQNFSDAANTEPHWGYADRVVPCVNDPGSCAYLDVVYHSHDLGMIYVGIIWLTITAVFLVWAALQFFMNRPNTVSANANGLGGLKRLGRTVATFSNQYLLRDCFRPIFGRTTRLQVLILAVLAGYLLIWSFVGIVYKKWITSVKDMPGVFNTRTSLGPWSDRVGVLAYALTPLSVFLSSRESILSLITGVPYQHFNFLHRWLGYIILIQSGLHTIGWSIVEIKLYQPQPSVAEKWIKQLYMIWGVVAMVLILLLYIFSLPVVIRLTGYEFFRKSHYVLAIVYVGACIGHWENLQCFMIPSILIWFIDRVVRAVRTFFIHRGVSGARFGFSAKAPVTIFRCPKDGDVVRLDFTHPNAPWRVGEHFYLCFTESSIWQSHPFTPLSLPGAMGGAMHHSYLFRAKSGETKKVASALRKALTNQAEKSPRRNTQSETSVILTGPYGESTLSSVTPRTNILCIAGGTGIMYVLPVLLQMANEASPGESRSMRLVWTIRQAADLEWVRGEIESLQLGNLNCKIDIYLYVTRESKVSLLKEKPTDQSKVSIGQTISSEGITSGRPKMGDIVAKFTSDVVSGPTIVFASGPGAMMSDLREAVAAHSSGSQVWKGQERYDISLRCDDRLER